LGEAPSCKCEYYRPAFRNINGDYPFAHPPLKFIELGVQEFDDQRRLAGHGYDGHFIRVEG
jgi:hypothetical protein